MGVGSSNPPRFLSAAETAAALKDIIGTESSSVQRMLLDCFSQPSKPFAPTPAALWAALTSAAFVAAGGQSPLLIAREGAAIELLFAAFDILDDLEDGEPPGWVERAGIPRVLNLTTWMMVRSFELLGDPGANPIISRRKLHALPSLLALLTDVGRGQAIELEMDATTVGDPQEIIDLMRIRSGGLGRSAAWYGAALGTDDPALARRLGDFGEHTAMYAQLVNDAHDVGGHDHKRGDLEAGKLTYPIALAARLTGRPVSELTPEAVEACGATAASWVRARAFLAEAQALADTLRAADILGPLLPKAGD